jgi:uncharacterized protein (TIGR02271 family)
MAYEETTNAAGVGIPTQVIVGLFNDASDAHQAVTQLKERGFSSSQIGAAFRDDRNRTYPDRGIGVARSTTGTVKRDAENWWEKVKDAFRSEDDKVETRREAAARSTVGTDPYAGDEYEYDFAEKDFEGSLAQTGIPADRASYLTRNLRAGGAIVTVRDADRSAEAEEIITANHGKVRYEDAGGANAVGNDYPDAAIADADEAAIDAADSTGRGVTDTGYTDRDRAYASDRVQLFGEVLRVHKERINRGEVRVRKDVITENQTVEVPVTREELVLERVAVPANTPATSTSIGRDQEIRVPLSEDRVRVEKVPVVTEEVRVGKREVSDVARVNDDVRHEELRVDPDGEMPSRAVGGEDVADDLRRRG